MIATQQIETGELAERDFKVLILPYSITLSAAETDAIASFAGNGGMVVADMQTGIMDEHCKLHASGSLDGLFGIERFGHRTRPFSGDDCIKPVEGFEYPALNEELLLEQEVTFPIAEPGVRLTSGKAAFVDDFMRKMPVIAINLCGKYASASPSPPKSQTVNTAMCSASTCIIPMACSNGFILKTSRCLVMNASRSICCPAMKRQVSGRFP